MTDRSETDSDPLGCSDSALESLVGKMACAGQVTMLVPGMIVGDKYRIETRLGSGGMGVVYRATHVVSQKPVALKCMLRSANDEIARARFIREARAAARIDHPNVVNVYDVGQEDDYCYLVMELLHGTMLRERMLQGPLEIEEVLTLLIPAMRGVSAIHRAGVIHRDLKPENIFLCQGPDGTAREAKVLDFGISALTVDEPDDLTITDECATPGTPLYMSPEQVQSAADLDGTTDIYALGVMLYEALTGTTPFDAKSRAQLFHEVLHTPPRSLRELRPTVPPALDRVVLRALSKQRDDRYASIEALIDALAPFAGSPTMVSTSTPASTRKQRWPRGPAVMLYGLAASAAGAWLSSNLESALRPPSMVVAELRSRELGEVVNGASLPATPERVETLSPSLPDTSSMRLPMQTQVEGTHGARAPEPAATAAPALTRSSRPQRRVARPESAQKPSAATEPAKSTERPDCELGYSIDSSGHKKYRPECLLSQ